MHASPFQALLTELLSFARCIASPKKSNKIVTRTAMTALSTSECGGGRYTASLNLCPLRTEEIMRNDRSRRWILPILSLTALTLLIARCAAHSGGISASTKPLTPGGYTELKEVSGEDCQYYLLGFMPLSRTNKLRNAVADAMDDVKGADALIKVTVDTYMHYWILWSTVCTEVHGTAVQSH